MEIRFCPECGDEVRAEGLAYWPEVEEPVNVVHCMAVACGWAGIDAEYRVFVSASRASSAA